MPVNGLPLCFPTAIERVYYILILAERNEIVVRCWLHIIRWRQFSFLCIPSLQFCYCKESNLKTIIIMFGKLEEDASIIKEQFTINDAHTPGGH